MTVVNYSSNEMSNVIKSYDDEREKVESIAGDMKKEVNNIRNNWKGTDAIAAESDLTAITTQIMSIESNLQKIVEMFEKVESDFGQIKY